MSDLAKQAFIDRWARPQIQEWICGKYFSATPSRVYWALIFDTVTGNDMIKMAKELIELYPDDIGSNPAIQHALEVIRKSQC